MTVVTCWGTMRPMPPRDPSSRVSSYGMYVGPNAETSLHSTRKVRHDSREVRLWKAYPPPWLVEPAAPICAGGAPLEDTAEAQFVKAVSAAVVGVASRVDLRGRHAAEIVNRAQPATVLRIPLPLIGPGRRPVEEDPEAQVVAANVLAHNPRRPNERVATQHLLGSRLTECAGEIEGSSVVAHRVRILVEDHTVRGDDCALRGTRDLEPSPLRPPPIAGQLA